MSNSKKQLHEMDPVLPEYGRQKGDAPKTQFGFTLWYADGFYCVHWHDQSNVVRYKNRKRFDKSWNFRESLARGTSAGAPAQLVGGYG